MRRALDVSGWPFALLFICAGLMAAILAFASYNLFDLGMANLRLIRLHGAMALFDGAALQLGELALSGGVALAAYLGFKLCEGEMILRFRRWSRRDQ